MCGIRAAVPSGEHSVRLTIDFRPVFPLYELEQRVRFDAPPDDALERVLARSAHADADERRHAAAELGAFPGEAARAVPALVRLTRDGDPGVRISAVRSLGDFPEMAATSTARLVEMLTAGAPEDGWAAYILGKLGRSTPEVLAALEKARRSDDEVLREDATGALEALSAPR